MKFKRLCAFLLLVFITCSSVFAENKFVKVVFIGNYQSGKTCIWKRLLDEGFSEYERRSDTLSSRNILRTVGDDVLCISLWDTAGSEKYYDEVMDFIRDANFVFIVHDLYEKLNGEVKVYLSRMYRDVRQRMTSDSKIVLVGSKYDLRHRDIANSAEQAKLLEEVAEHIPCPFVLTSAKEDDDPGMAKILEYIVEQCKEMKLPNHSSSLINKKFNSDILAPAPNPKSSEGSGFCVIA